MWERIWKIWNESNKFFWTGKAIPKTAARRSEISSYLGSNVRQLLVFLHSTLLVETANIHLIILILIGRPDFVFGATPRDHHHQQQQQRHGLYLSTSWSIGLLVPVSLVLCWRNMTTEYSSPYKVGLIDVGTKFAQSKLAWSGIVYGKLNFRGTVALVERSVVRC